MQNFPIKIRAFGGCLGVLKLKNHTPFVSQAFHSQQAVGTPWLTPGTPLRSNPQIHRNCQAHVHLRQRNMRMLGSFVWDQEISGFPIAASKKNPKVNTVSIWNWPAWLTGWLQLMLYRCTMKFSLLWWRFIELNWILTTQDHSLEPFLIFKSFRIYFPLHLASSHIKRYDPNPSLFVSSEKKCPPQKKTKHLKTATRFLAGICPILWAMKDVIS